MRRIQLVVALLLAVPTALAAQDDPTVYYPSVDVAEAFGAGRPIIEVDLYKIHASRRVEGGQAEVHTWDTDLVYVLEGTATFVTGGEVIDGAATGPGEIRGASISGGTVRHLVPGDVVVVPNGTPHWFKEVDGPFLYYVVKVTSRD